MEINLKFCDNDVKELKKESVEEELQDVSGFEAHYMPCFINLDGEAAIGTHFAKYVEVNDRSHYLDMQEYSSSFRGFPLRGREVRAPAEHSFVLLQEAKSRVEGRTLMEGARFERFVYWNVSQTPCPGDALYKAIKWIDIAQVVHSN